MSQHNTIRAYIFPLILALSLLSGGLAGYYWGQSVQWLKPFGDIFLNLILTAVVPLIFFSVASAIAKACSMGTLSNIISSMLLVFIFTSVIAAIYALGVVKLFPPAQGVYLNLAITEKMATPGFLQQLASIFTVSDFSNLFSHKNILALILFSILVGLAVGTIPEQGKTFMAFLTVGETVFMRVFSLIMYYAPVGFFAYFAVLVSELGPKLMESYARIAVIYYVSGLLYFCCFLTAYAYLAGRWGAVKLFWKNIFLPAATSLATCSSAASIPANLLATKAMRVPAEICETVIPLGSLIHKDGSVLGGIFKIAFLFGLFHLDFSGGSTLLIALAVSLLVGTVMGAIPSGGMLGELLILTVYGFPPSVLVAIAAISIIIDPLATMLNVTANTASSMLIARLAEGTKTG